MNWHDFLSTFSGDTLDVLLGEVRIRVPSDKKMKVGAIVSYIKREKEQGQEILLNLIKEKLMTYELRASIARLGLSQPIGSEDCYNYLISKLELMEYEDSGTPVKKVPEEEIITEENAEPEYSEEDEEDMVVDALGTIALFKNQNYSLGQSVADIVDNSVDIGASEIDIYYEMDRELGKRYLIVSDNGAGMTDDELRKGMIIGLQKKRKEAEMGPIQGT